jgi:TolA-binding protein
MEKSNKDKKKFSDYYKNKEFRDKHKTYMLEKTPCKLCGYMTARCNMTRHKQSKNCNPIKNENIEKINELKEKIAQMNDEIKKLFEEIKGSHFNKK